MIQTTVYPATDPQVNLIINLAAERPNWQDHLGGHVFETVFDVLGNVENPGPKFISKIDARLAIKALLALPKQHKIEKTPGLSGLRQAATGFIELQALLKTLHIGHYALPRKADGVLEFFEVIEREGKDGKPATRWVNRLLGAPGDWNRDKLSIPLQAAAGRAISGDWIAAAKLYADHFQTCARCDAPLSHPRSRSAKIGYQCAKIWGWPW